jgi:Spy/CpxP family protein refolding chaperone
MRPRAYVYFLLTFLLGAVIGGTCVYYYAWSSGHWHRPFNKSNFVSHLKKDLSLSETQVQQVQQIIDGSTKRFELAQQQAGSQFNAIREETRTEIRQILTPQQSQKFDDLVHRWDERRKRLNP